MRVGFRGIHRLSMAGVRCDRRIDLRKTVFHPKSKQNMTSRKMESTKIYRSV